MARIRTIKPEFWQDEKLVSESDSVRLIFLGLISLADDCGRLLDKPVKIEADLFDGASDRRADVVSALNRLAEIGRIRRGKTASGQQVIEIVNWRKHQRVDHPNVKAAFPEIVEPQQVTSIRERFANDSREIREAFAHHTNDQRPEPTTRTNENDQLSLRSHYSATSEEKPDHDAALRRVLPVVHESGHAALRELLAAVPEPTTWAGTIFGMAAGMQSPNNTPISRERLAVAVCDFVGAGKHRDNPSLGLFRGFVKRAKAPEQRQTTQQTEAEYRAEFLQTLRRQNERRRRLGQPEKPEPAWAKEIDAMFPDGRTKDLAA